MIHHIKTTVRAWLRASLHQAIALLDGAVFPPQQPAIATSADTTDSAASAPTEQPATTTWVWQPLLGHTIELGTTGFAIGLLQRHGRPVYRLTDPEGFGRATADNLDELKAYGEKLARWRAELECAPDDMTTLASELRRIADWSRQDD
jgi:hypothetical protein